MKNGIALLIISGILLSVGLVLMLLNYEGASTMLFGMGSILLISGLTFLKKFQGQPVGKRSSI
ncbi:hypothetical protein [Lysinibacillus sp. 54212]|uniref:hypothetical protein n=1 Tax=Lysinibacillus sp. 54212 TaxID=3119829 RepID=UPI002FC70C2A